MKKAQNTVSKLWFSKGSGFSVVCKRDATSLDTLSAASVKHSYRHVPMSFVDENKPCSCEVCTLKK